MNSIKVLIKSKNELLNMGYENNQNSDDFLNVVAGKIVTLDLDKTRKAITCDGIIYFSTNFPTYMIYDYFIKCVIKNNILTAEDSEFTLKEICKKLHFNSPQAVNVKLTNALAKIKRIMQLNNFVKINEL
jgi:hypothetical protein